MICIRDKGITAKIVLCIFNEFLHGAKSEFEPPQAFIAERRPAQMEAGETIVRTTLDRLPHEQVIRAQLLIFQIGRTEFIQRLLTFVKKNGSGHRLLLPAHDGYESAIQSDRMAVQVLKKTERLRRQSVVTPRPAMQRIINFDGHSGVAEFDAQSMPLGFANTAANRGIHPSEQLGLAAAEMNNVAEEPQRGSRMRRHLFVISPAFDVLPVTLLAVAHCGFIKEAQTFSIGIQRRTKIGER